MIIINSYSQAANDPDAQAYIDAIGTLTGTEIAAVDTLTTELKSAGLWDKHGAIYPILGGTASTHKWNLKDPRDLDVAHRLLYSVEGDGFWTHTADGMENYSSAADNGAIANTNYFYSDVTAQGENWQGSISIYSNLIFTGLTRGRALVALTLTNNNFHLEMKRSITDNKSRFYAGTVNTITDVDVTDDGTGFSTGTTDGTDIKIYQNAAEVANLAVSARSGDITTDRPLVIGSLMAGSTPWEASDCLGTFHSSARYAFVSIGDVDITPTDAANLNNIVEAFQVTLGRNN